MTKSAAQRALIAWQATTNLATLMDLIAWQASLRKADGESVGQFLERLLASRAALIEVANCNLAAKDDAADMTGGDPITLVFDEMDSALRSDERLRTRFFEGVGSVIVSVDVDDGLAELRLHRSASGIGSALVQAALDGRLSLLSEGHFALIRAADCAGIESRAS